MQTISFKIGDFKHRDMNDAASIYKQTISQRGPYVRSQTENKAATSQAMKKSNINFGAYKMVDYVTEAKAKFMP